MVTTSAGSCVDESGVNFVTDSTESSNDDNIVDGDDTGCSEAASLWSSDAVVSVELEALGVLTPVTSAATAAVVAFSTVEIIVVVEFCAAELSNDRLRTSSVRSSSSPVGRLPAMSRRPQQRSSVLSAATIVESDLEDFVNTRTMYEWTAY